MGGAFAIQLILTILFMPESAYHRVGVLNIDTSESAAVIEEKIQDSGTEHHETSRTKGSDEKPKSFMRELLPYSGYYDRSSFLKTTIRPFMMMLSPMVFWATMQYTILISWLVLISITLSQIFSAPPYNFSVSAVGASNLSSFVASAIGTAVAGPLIDGLVRTLSKMNKGTFGTYLLYNPGFDYRVPACG
jgi:hypothetical protein